MGVVIGGHSFTEGVEGLTTRREGGRAPTQVASGIVHRFIFAMLTVGRFGTKDCTENSAEFAQSSFFLSSRDFLGAGVSVARVRLWTG